MREAVRMITILTVIAFISGSGLALLERITRRPIEYQRLRLVKGPAVLAVFSDYDNNPIKEYRKDVMFRSEDKAVTKTLFPARKGGKLIAVAYEVAGDGYHGELGIMVGVDVSTGRLTGMRLMTHTETPGLGARATDPAFYEQFTGMGTEDLALREKGGEIDAISGATITSQGVVSAVKHGLKFFTQSREQIVNACSG